jgi:hypothetical protein
MKRHRQRGRPRADARDALAVRRHALRQPIADVLLEVSRHALEPADRYRLGLLGVLFFDAAAAACRLARSIAGAAEDAGEHVRHPVDHVGVVVSPLRDEADVLGYRRVCRASPLAVDDLVKVGRVGHVGGLHGALSP